MRACWAASTGSLLLQCCGDTKRRPAFPVSVGQALWKQQNLRLVMIVDGSLAGAEAGQTVISTVTFSVMNLSDKVGNRVTRHGTPRSLAWSTLRWFGEANTTRQN